MKFRILGLGLSSLLFSSCWSTDHDMDNMDHNTMKGGSPPLIVEGKFESELIIPQSVDFKNAKLEAQVINGTWSGLGYSAGGLLGPILTARSGETVTPTLYNKLSEGTNLHWHGLSVPVDQDGLPEDKIEAGGSKNYSFTLKNRAGMYWYHPHLMGSTARQAYQGLAGLILLRDAEEDALKLPSGEFEVPLVVQDRRSAGSTYDPTMNEVMTGFMGDQVSVNGITSPVLKVKQGVYRLRLLNGSNARIYNFALSDDREMTLIGTDGGLLSSPKKITEVLMGPGERVDLLVSFNTQDQSKDLYLVSKVFANGGTQGTQAFKIMKFSVGDQKGMDYQAPSVLSTIERIPAQATIVPWLLTAPIDMNSSGMGMHKINGKNYDPKSYEITVKAGELGTWNFQNATHEIHPIHIHGVQFQILERVGRSLQATDQGWKDGFVLLPGEQAKIALKFNSDKGRHLLHCHNLEHEEDGMMLQYLVE